VGARSGKRSKAKRTRSKTWRSGGLRRRPARVAAARTLSGSPPPGSRRCSSAISRTRLTVPLAVSADAVVWREDREEVLVQLLDGGGGEPARTGARLALLVDLAVVRGPVRGYEHRVQVIDELLIGQLAEAAQALLVSHVASVR
jgi:hypothetical protein